MIIDDTLNLIVFVKAKTHPIKSWSVSMTVATYVYEYYVFSREGQSRAKFFFMAIFEGSDVDLLSVLLFGQWLCEHFLLLSAYHM